MRGRVARTRCLERHMQRSASISPILEFTLIFACSNVTLWCCPVDHRELGHAKVLLNDGTHYGNIVRNGGWIMYVFAWCQWFNLHANWYLLRASRPHVEPGTYILTVQSKMHVFDEVSKMTSTSRAHLTNVPSYVWISLRTMIFQKFALITQAHH